MNGKQPHKHAELIKAWADGADIEIYDEYCKEWQYITSPVWCEEFEYRIKPEPKPDVVVEWLVEKQRVTYFDNRSVDSGKNLRLTFDSETGKLKSAEVLK
jgi:hypothetical protein